MSTVRSLLLDKELCELWVSSSDAFFSVLLFHELAHSEITAVEHLSYLASLLLLDVISVGISEEQDATED